MQHWRDTRQRRLEQGHPEGRRGIERAATAIRGLLLNHCPLRFAIIFPLGCTGEEGGCLFDVGSVLEGEDPEVARQEGVTTWSFPLSFLFCRLFVRPHRHAPVLVRPAAVVVLCCSCKHFFVPPRTVNRSSVSRVGLTWGPPRRDAQRLPVLDLMSCSLNRACAGRLPLLELGSGCA